MSAFLGRFLLVDKGSQLEFGSLPKRTKEKLDLIDQVRREAGFYSQVEWVSHHNLDDEGLVLHVFVDLPAQLQFLFKGRTAGPASAEAIAEETRSALREYAPKMMLACSVHNTRCLEEGKPISSEDSERRRSATKHYVAKWNRLAKTALLSEPLQQLSVLSGYLGRGIPATVTGRVQVLTRDSFLIEVTDVQTDDATDLDLPHFETLLVDRTEDFQGLAPGAALQRYMDTPNPSDIRMKLVLKRRASDGAVLPEARLLAIDEPFKPS